MCVPGRCESARGSTLPPSRGERSASQPAAVAAGLGDAQAGAELDGEAVPGGGAAAEARAGADVLAEGFHVGGHRPLGFQLVHDVPPRACSCASSRNLSYKTKIVNPFLF